MLNPTSKLKGEKDYAKYEIARKLKVCQNILGKICLKGLLKSRARHKDSKI